MNKLFKRASLVAYATFIFTIIGMFSLTNVFANAGNKNGDGDKINYTRNFQTVSDTAAIMQKCMDLPELQQYFTKGNNGKYKQVYVMQYPRVFSANLGVTKFSKKVLFEQRGDIYKDNADVYFMFSMFSIIGNNATVEFYYHYNYTSTPASFEVSINLQKNGNQWDIISSKLNKG